MLQKYKNKQMDGRDTSKFEPIVSKGNSINNKIIHNVDNVKYTKLK